MSAEQAAVEMEPGMQLVAPQEVEVPEVPRGQEEELVMDGYDLWQEVEDCEMEPIDPHLELFPELYDLDIESVMESFGEFCEENNQPGNLPNFLLYCNQYARDWLLEPNPDFDSEDSGTFSEDSDRLQSDDE